MIVSSIELEEEKQDTRQWYGAYDRNRRHTS
jgi:hypothetical protein